MIEHDELEQVISGVDRPRARDGFRRDLRRALVATAASEWSDRKRPARPPFAFGVPRFALALGVIVAAAFGTTGVAAAASLPGDAAYPVKIAYEQVELALATDDASRIEVLARQADRRLDELNQVSSTRPDDASVAAAAYQETVAKFQAAVDALKVSPPDDRQDAALNVADEAAQKHIDVLEQLRDRHDGPGIDEALDQAKQLDQHVRDKDSEKRKDGHEAAPSARPGDRSREGSSPRPSSRPTETPHPSGSHDGGDD